MLARIDGFLLDKTQKFCDKFQYLTGLTKFRLEKWAIIIGIVSYWMFAIWIVFLLVMIAALLLMVAGIFMVCKVESDERIFLARGELRYDVENVPELRIMNLATYGILLLFSFLLALISSAPELLWLCWWIVSVLARIYFSACVPRPPGKSKVREWSEKSVMWLRDQLPPAPVPVPNP